MRAKIATLSPRTEFFVVIGLVYGNSVFRYLLSLYNHGFSPAIIWYDSIFIRSLLIEIAILICLGYFLYLRGWKFSHFNLSPTIKGTGIGILLWLCANLLCMIFYILISSTFSNAAIINSISFHGHISLQIALLVSIVNPFFEEVFHLGFIVRALESHGPSFAIGISTFLRLLVHLYQGPLVVVSILPIGILFTVYYWHSRQLWPVIFAHGIFDFVGLLQIS